MFQTSTICLSLITDDESYKKQGSIFVPSIKGHFNMEAIFAKNRSLVINITSFTSCVDDDEDVGNDITFKKLVVITCPKSPYPFIDMQVLALNWYNNKGLLVFAFIAFINCGSNTPWLLLKNLQMRFTEKPLLPITHVEFKCMLVIISNICKTILLSAPGFLINCSFVVEGI